MARGAEFAIPASRQLPLPEQFKEEAAIYSEHAGKITDEFAHLKAGEEQLSAQAYRKALEVAQSVLDQVPDHLLASQLKGEAEQGIASLRIDDALAIWDFEQLVDLSKSLEGKRAFSYYLENEKELRSLLEPWVNRKKLSSWEEAQLWWGNWKTAVGKIPKQPPDSLMKAIRREEEKRRDQWAAVLAELINKELLPAECQSIADSLRDGLDDFNLQSFQKIFLRKADVARAFEFIKKREWDAAQVIINSLDETHPDTRRLKIHLEVEHSKQQGVEVLAKTLKREWGIVKTYIDDAFGLLLEAIEDAWRLKHDDAITDLRDVASRALTGADGSDPKLDQIRQWENWFIIEQAVKVDESATSLKQLIAYAQENGKTKETFHLRLSRLIDHWRDHKNLVMLAWANEAFDWSLAGDPRELLWRENDDAAKKVLVTLKARKDLELDEVSQMVQELSGREAAWSRLDEYLNLVPRTVSRIKPSTNFERAKTMLHGLKRVMELLDELLRADLRQEPNKNKLELSRAILRELSGVAMRARLLQQVERLEPLSRLYAIEKDIRDAAFNCRSEKEVEIYEPDAFAKLARTLRNLIRRFSDAKLEDRQMWNVVSKEYREMVYRVACIHAPLSLPDLNDLAAKMDELNLKEKEFREAMENVWKTKPSVGMDAIFNPLEHEDYLAKIPPNPPLSRRDFLFFKYRSADVEPLKSIILQSREKLPKWIRTYLDEGIPPCADER
jgi:hypothetical protein